MIIDAHMHIGPWIVDGKNYGLDKNEIKRLMNDLKIDKTCSVCEVQNSLFHVSNVKERNPNNENILKISRLDKSFIPIYWANPFKPEECKKALDRGFKALKYHSDLHILPISDEKLEPIIDISRQYNVPFFVHTDEKDEHSSILKVKEVAEKHPNVDFVALHAINSVSITFFKAKAIGMYDLNNIYYCTGGRTHFIEFRLLYETLGPKKIIFSSDFPFGHPAVFMKAIELLTEDKKEREFMLGKNIQRLLKL